VVGSFRRRVAAGVLVYFLCFLSTLQLHHNYLFVVETLHLLFTFVIVVWSGGPLTPAGTKVVGGTSKRSPSTCLKTPQRGDYLNKLLCSLVPRKHAPKRY